MLRSYIAAFLLCLPLHSEPNAATLYRLSERVEQQFRNFQRCAVGLGLNDLRQYEDKKVVSLFQDTHSAYTKVIKTKDAIWARRAAYRLAAFYHEAWQSILNQRSYRGLDIALAPYSLPSGHAFEDSIIGHFNSRIQLETQLLSQALLTDLKDIKTDPELWKEIELKLKKPIDVPTTPSLEHLISSPYENEIRYKHPYFYSYSSNQWQQLNAIQAVDILRKQTQSSNLVIATRAQLLLAQSGHDVPSRFTLQSMQSKDKQARILAYEIARIQPKQELLHELITAWAKQENKPPFQILFSTLLRSLLEESERILLALKALIKANPALAKEVINNAALPQAERAWLIAELGQTTLIPAYQKLAKSADDVTSALGIYGLMLAKKDINQLFTFKYPATPLKTCLIARFKQL